MATVTPNYSWPVPTSTDLVKDGATAIEALGDAIDATVFGLGESGLTLINSTTFSAVASQSVNNVFSATYQNYRIMVQSVNASGAAFNMRLRVSGADSTASNYSGAYYYRVMGGAGSGTTGSGPTTSWSLNGETAQKSDNVSMDIFRPFETTFTYTNFFNNSEEGASTYNMLIGGNIFNAATSFTGFTIFPASSTITGTVRTYGYNNS